MDLAHDFRSGWRVFRLQPRFAAFVVGVLALGIGGNATMFGVVNGTLLRPLPYAEPDRLVRLYTARADANAFRTMLSLPDIEQLRAATDLFESVVAFGGGGVVMTGGRRPRQPLVERVTADFFDVFRVTPARGRIFAADEYREGEPAVVIVGHGLWQRDLAADPAVVGRTLRLDGRPHTVIGVLPRGFELWGRPVELILPLVPEERLADPRTRWFNAVGRLQEGVRIETAQAYAEQLFARLERTSPDTHGGWRLLVLGLREDLTAFSRTPLLVLLGAVGFVLLIACANVAHLMLVRGARRGREMAIRSALGAGRWRLVRQQLFEGAALAAAGGGLGLLLSFWGVEMFLAVNPFFDVRAELVAVDSRVAAFTVVVSFVTAILFALLPALRASGVDVVRALHGSGSSLGGTRQQSRFRSALVVTEVALAMVLLVGAGLMIETVRGVLAIDPGFRADQLVWARLRLPQDRYAAADAARFYDRLVEELEARGGVRGAALVSNPPMDRGHMATRVGTAEATAETTRQATLYRTDVGYFDTLRIPIRQGSDFPEDLGADDARLVLVSTTLANRLWPGGRAVGRRLRVGTGDDPPEHTVIGVVGDVRHRLLSADVEAVYVHHRQAPSRSAVVVADTSAAPTAAVAKIREVVAAIDSELPVEDVGTLDEQLARGSDVQRGFMGLLTAFAALAVFLALVGLYGVLTYATIERTRELGIRIALGASPADLVGGVLARGALLSGVGVALGLLGAAGLTRFLGSFLYGIQATDPTVFTVLGIAMITASCWASAAPALRAARIDPLAALRAD